MIHIALDEVSSTNTWLAQHVADLSHLTMVTAAQQTAGRGQRGNSWESEPGANITFSLLIRPEGVPARNQFSISEATALAITDLLALYGVKATVKWPNDIYVGDRKICGILIEHAIMGTSIMHSIIGAGLNVNQTRFVSDAPNPVSLLQLITPSESAVSAESLTTSEHSDSSASSDITGRYNLEKLRTQLASLLEERLAAVSKPLGRENLHATFLQRLYRGDGGLYPYRDRATGLTFEAAISDIEPMGLLHLRLADGEERVYAFKEVEYIHLEK